MEGMPTTPPPQEENLEAQTTKEKERKSFDEVSEQEQIQRYRDLKSLFTDKDKLEKEEDKKRANYFDFFNNVYKYSDRLDIEGINKEKVSGTFERATAGNYIIKSALDLFLEVKKNQSGIKNNMRESQISLEGSIDRNSYGFADVKNHQIDVNKLTNLFKWSLGAFVRGGEKIGRTPGIKEDEIEPLSEDLEAILKHVNAFR